MNFQLTLIALNFCLTLAGVLLLVFMIRIGLMHRYMASTLDGNTNDFATMDVCETTHPGEPLNVDVPGVKDLHTTISTPRYSPEDCVATVRSEGELKAILSDKVTPFRPPTIRG